MDKPKLINHSYLIWLLKFVFSKKATKIDEIFTVNLTVCSKCQIDGEDFVKCCGLLRKRELYKTELQLFFGDVIIDKKALDFTW